MKSSPIYNIVNIPGRSARSFGADSGFDQDIRVGTSRTNSHTLAEVLVRREVLEDGRVEFRLIVDGEVIKRGILNGREFAHQAVQS